MSIFTREVTANCYECQTWHTTHTRHTKHMPRQPLEIIQCPWLHQPRSPPLSSCEPFPHSISTSISVSILQDFNSFNSFKWHIWSVCVCVCEGDCSVCVYVFSVYVCGGILCVCVSACGKQMKMRVLRNTKFKFTFMAANESTNKVPAPTTPPSFPRTHTNTQCRLLPLPLCPLTGIVSKSLSVSRLQQPQQQQLKPELRQELEPGARITIATSESCPLFVILFYFRLNACAKVRTDKERGVGRVGSLVRREFKAKLWLHKILRPT